MNEKTGRFPVNDGDLLFESAGEGDAIVFLHGFGLDSRMWAPQFEVFQSTFRVIRYDLRGFGGSSLPPQAGYAHEDDLNALLSGLAAVPAHVVGLSMGGRMALRFAAAYPQSVRSLVLADSALDGQTWTADWQTRWSGMCEAAKAGEFPDAKRRWREHPLFDSARANPFSAALLARMVEDYSGWHWYNRDTARVPSPPLAERLGEIRVPSVGHHGSARHFRFSVRREAPGGKVACRPALNHPELRPHGQPRSAAGVQCRPPGVLAGWTGRLAHPSSVLVSITEH